MSDDSHDPTTHVLLEGHPTPIGGNKVPLDGKLVPVTVCRTVIYTSYGTPGGEYASLARAAIVTQTAIEAPELRTKEKVGHVGLCILNPTGQFFNPSVPYSEKPKPGHWSWPPRA